MSVKVEKTPEAILNPMLSATLDGTVINSNEASESLLHEWGVRVGEKLPSNIVDLVKRVISLSNPEIIELDIGNKVYLVVFQPFPDQKSVIISGFDISKQKELEIRDRKLIEVELFNAHEKIQEQSEELQEFNEELQSQNEELKSQNEELQAQSEKILNTNEKLRVNKQWLQAIIDGSSDIIFVKDLVGRFILINKQLEDQLGVTREEIKGKNGYDIYSPEWAEYYRMHDQKVLETGTSDQIEEIAELNDGLHTFLSNRFLLYDSMGKPYALCCVSSDITERKQAEEALRMSELQYRTLFNSIDEGFCIIEMIFDKNGKPIDYRFLETNPSFEKQTGLIDAVGKRMRELAPKHEEHWFEIYGRIAMTGEPARFQNPAEQLHRYYDVYAFRYGQPEKKQVAILFNDITERKQEEHKTYRYNHILNGINRIFSNVVQAKTEEELGNECLSVALDVTSGGIGFVNLIGDDGLMHDIAISEGGWHQCLMYDKTGHRRPPGNFIVHGLYGYVVKTGRSFLTNDPQLHPESIGLPSGHPLLTSFLAVPLIEEGKTVGMLGVGNREGGYSYEQLEDLEAVAPAITQSLKRKREESERKHAEEALRESEKRLQSIIDESPGLVFVKDLEGRFLLISKQLEELLGKTNDEVKGKSDYDIFPPEVAEYYRNHDSEVIKTGVPKQFEEVADLVDGHHVFLANKFPLFDSNGRPYAICAISTDITERKKSEEALRESEKQLATDLDVMKILHRLGTLFISEGNLESILGEIVDAAIAISDSDFGNIQLIDPVSQELKIAAYRGFPNWWVDYWNTVPVGKGSCGTALGCGKIIIVEDVEQSPIFLGTPGLEIQLKAGVRAIQSTPLITRSGKPLGMFSTHYKMPYKPNDNALRLLDLLARQAADIIERSQAEEALKEAHDSLEVRVQERTEELEKAYTSLREIDIVRKQEIHHRIKNNLQVISSLLDLQAEKFNNRKCLNDCYRECANNLEVMEAFKESQDRVISMALIHEELHKGGKLDTLNFSHYIEELTDNLLLTYRVSNNGIILDTDIEEDIFFDMDTAVPLGIIINELVSNSLKHAFTDRENGEIEIKFHREKNEESNIENCCTAFILSISDNGIGIPKDLEIEDFESLGIQLVTTLVDQLDGELELRRDNGTEFTIKFTNNNQTTTTTPQLLDND